MDNGFNDSLIYAKNHKNELVADLIKDKTNSENKIAIFMAGSPGAGKSEIATSLIECVDSNLVRIDADKFRVAFPEYNGSNSVDFQKGSSWLVDHAFTFLLRKGYSFILDATFAISKSVQNIKRAIGRNYGVTIYYVYQDPIVSWKFIKAREKKEGRVVPKERFINAYFESRKNIKKVKEMFGSKIELNIIIKNYESNISEILFDVDNVNLALLNNYTVEQLEKKLYDWKRASGKNYWKI